MTEREFFATCPFGFEQVLAQELKALRVRRVRPLQGGVAFFGPAEAGYRACLWLRSASRVLMVLDRVDAGTADALYAGVKAIAWEEHVGVDATIAVAARGTNDALKNTQFSALKVKDAVCDRLREVRGARPSVSAYRPSVPLWVTIHNKKATVYVDFAGEPLHRRGYREDQVQVEAPVKEALAAALLLKAGWPAKAKEGAAFCDPLCGSGTFAIEAAMMAYDMAPGVLRDYWGFQGWAQFDEAAFDALIDEADVRLERALEENTVPICGFDLSERAVAIAEGCAKRTGLGSRITFVVADCARLPETLAQCGVAPEDAGLMVTNPPYGVRLLAGELDRFYASLRAGLRGLSDAWQFCAITPDAAFDVSIGYDVQDSVPVFNGGIEAAFRTYRLGASMLEPLTVMTLEGREVQVEVSSAQAEQFAARFRKMARIRRKWARGNGVHAYRLYDADLPDYALAVDLVEGVKIGDELKGSHGMKMQSSRADRRRKADNHAEGDCGRAPGASAEVDRGARTVRRDLPRPERPVDIEDFRARPAETYLVISEYRAPKEIDEVKAKRRFADACAIAGAIMEIDPARVFTRVRQQARGGGQYSRDEHRAFRVLVEESGHVFELDLRGYLDTGLFLDHRVTRQMVERQVAGKRFLNLFAYTGSVSVYAACGGARSTLTVDLSGTYLDWARRNMQRNGFAGKGHGFVRADVMDWLRSEAKTQSRFDLIFVDPPTFSNSKSMGKRTWDVQRDHVKLLEGVTRLLAQGGEAIFSCNLRTFKPDIAELERRGIRLEDITAQTIPQDFERNPRIHCCYRVTRVQKS